MNAYVYQAAQIYDGSRSGFSFEEAAFSGVMGAALAGTGGAAVASFGATGQAGVLALGAGAGVHSLKKGGKSFADGNYATGAVELGAAALSLVAVGSSVKVGPGGPRLNGQEALATGSASIVLSRTAAVTSSGLGGTDLISMMSKAKNEGGGGGTGCFVAGTPVASSRCLVSIDSLEIGDRVQTYQEGQKTLSSSRLYVASLSLESGVKSVRVLGTREYLLRKGLFRVDASVLVQLPEVGIEGLARVVSLDIVEVPEGPGRVVMTTLTSASNDVYEMGFGEEVAPLRVTGSHPLYSLDRDDWVRELQVGERLQTAAGAVSVEALEKVRGTFRVYNLEVEGDHEFLVGDALVRAHNKAEMILDEPQLRLKRAIGWIQNREL